MYIDIYIHIYIYLYIYICYIYIYICIYVYIYIQPCSSNHTLYARLWESVCRCVVCLCVSVSTNTRSLAQATFRSLRAHAAFIAQTVNLQIYMCPICPIYMYICIYMCVYMYIYIYTYIYIYIYISVYNTLTRRAPSTHFRFQTWFEFHDFRRAVLWGGTCMNES